ncbi:hypothetical protein CFOL_v3_10771, partial [Cephalotus follicularis]
LHHLTTVLKCLAVNQFFAKMSKCSFGQTVVEYLGHIVSAAGVQADPNKIEAMTKWPTPTNIRQLRGFLGLTGYYRRFIKGYASLAEPLTELLKKDAFVWSKFAEQAFEELKDAMTVAHLLILPDFNKEFVVEI